MVRVASARSAMPPNGRVEVRRRERVAAGEERDVVPEAYQLLGQIRDDTFRSAVALRRHALVQRCNLRDPERPPHALNQSSARGPLNAVSCGASALGASQLAGALRPGHPDRRL